MPAQAIRPPVARTARSPERPADQEPEGDAGQMEQPGRDHEAEAIGERIGRLGQLGAVGVAVKDRERADQHRRDPERRARRERDHRAERDARTARCRSRLPASGTPRTPSTPPNAITSGNTTGSTQIAGMPRNAPHRPTATIATTWSGPSTGCREAAQQAARDAGLGVRRAPAPWRQRPSPPSAAPLARRVPASWSRRSTSHPSLRRSEASPRDRALYEPERGRPCRSHMRQRLDPAGQAISRRATPSAGSGPPRRTSAARPRHRG